LRGQDVALRHQLVVGRRDAFLRGAEPGLDHAQILDRLARKTRGRIDKRVEGGVTPTPIAIGP
jgi:hypothetical protein